MELTRLQFEIAKIQEELKKNSEQQEKIDRLISREEEKLDDAETVMEIEYLVLDPSVGEKRPVKEKVKPAELKKQKLDLKGEYELKQQVMNFDKSELLTRRFQYEEAEYHLDKARKEGDPRLEHHEKAFETASRRWEEIQKKSRESKAAFDAVDFKYSKIDDKIIASRLDLAKLKAERTRILKERDERMLRLNREKPQIANAIRNAPMLDFFDPTIKVQQQIVPIVLEDFNFAKVEKIDRCHTCHKGIDNPGYAVDFFPDKDREEERYVFRDEYLRQFVNHASGKTAPEACDVCKAEKGGMIVTTKHGTWASDEVIKYTKSLMAHPKLEVFAGPGSPHPLDKFGCTT